MESESDSLGWEWILKQFLPVTKNEKDEETSIDVKIRLKNKVFQRQKFHKKLEKINNEHTRLIEQLRLSESKGENVQFLIRKIEKLTEDGQKLTEELEQINQLIKEHRLKLGKDLITA